jgi:hypothetical protein
VTVNSNSQGGDQGFESPMRYQDNRREQDRWSCSLALGDKWHMQFADEETTAEYRRAWEEWLKQVEHVHRVFFGGEAIRPDQLKGLLNREARKKDAYDEARKRLLGLDASPLASIPTDENPFKTD